MKVTINGEEFEYERRMPLKDALAIEEECGRSYAEYEQLLAGGYAWAYAVLAWLLKEVPLRTTLAPAELAGEEAPAGGTPDERFAATAAQT